MPESAPQFTDPNNKSSIVTYINQHKRSYWKATLALTAIVLLIVVGLIYKFGLLNSIKTFFQPDSAQVSEKSLPISSAILTNPVIYQWKADVFGIVTKRTSSGFTLSSKGATLDVTYIKNHTRIYDSPSQNEIKLDQLMPGKYLRGDVWITSKTGVGFTSIPNDAVGGILYVDNTSTK